MRASLLTAAFFAGSTKGPWMREPPATHHAGALPSNSVSRSMAVGPAVPVRQEGARRPARPQLQATRVSEQVAASKAVESISMARHQVHFVLLSLLELAVWAAAASCGGAVDTSEAPRDGAYDAPEPADHANDAAGQIEEILVGHPPCLESSCGADALTGSDGPGTVARQGKMLLPSRTPLCADIMQGRSRPV